MSDEQEYATGGRVGPPSDGDEPLVDVGGCNCPMPEGLRRMSDAELAAHMAFSIRLMDRLVEEYEAPFVAMVERRRASISPVFEQLFERIAEIRAAKALETPGEQD